MVELVEGVSEEIVVALGRLVPQLSDSATLPTHEELAAVVASDATRLLVAKDEEGVIMGTLTLVVFPIPTGVRAWIEDVIVDERARGQGVGTELIDEALRIARAEGARTVDLTSRPSRDAATALYLRSGFTQRATHVYRYEL